MKVLKNNLIQAMDLNKDTSSKELLKILQENKLEPAVQNVIKEYINNLLIGLSNIIDIFEPQAICLGGSFVYFKDVIYTDLLNTYKEKKYVFNKENMPELKLAKLGNDAGIIGATIDKMSNI